MAFYGGPGSAPQSLNSSSLFFIYSILGPNLSLAASADLFKQRLGRSVAMGTIPGWSQLPHPYLWLGLDIPKNSSSAGPPRWMISWAFEIRGKLLPSGKLR